MVSLSPHKLTAIFAFGSCGGYSGKNIVSIFCGEGRNETLNATFSYPFRQVLIISSLARMCHCHNFKQSTIATKHLLHTNIYRGYQAIEAIEKHAYLVVVVGWYSSSTHLCLQYKVPKRVDQGLGGPLGFVKGSG